MRGFGKMANLAGETPTLPERRTDERIRHDADLAGETPTLPERRLQRFRQDLGHVFRVNIG